MTQDLVILFAAGMLVTAYLMVGQKALFTAIRLYALQSVLLGGVAIVMGVADQRAHLFASAALTIGLKGLLIPWFLMRVIDRIGIHREIEPILNVPSSLLICLGLTVVGYRVSTGLAEGARGAAHHVIGAALSMLLTLRTNGRVQRLGQSGRGATTVARGCASGVINTATGR